MIGRVWPIMPNSWPIASRVIWRGVWWPWVWILSMGRGVLTGKPHEVKDESSGKVWTAKVSCRYTILQSIVYLPFGDAKMGADGGD